MPRPGRGPAAHLWSAPRPCPALPCPALRAPRCRSRRCLHGTAGQGSRNSRVRRCRGEGPLAALSSRLVTARSRAAASPSSTNGSHSVSNCTRCRRATRSTARTTISARSTVRAPGSAGPPGQLDEVAHQVAELGHLRVRRRGPHRSSGEAALPLVLGEQVEAIRGWSVAFAAHDRRRRPAPAAHHGRGQGCEHGVERRREPAICRCRASDGSRR